MTCAILGDAPADFSAFCFFLDQFVSQAKSRSRMAYTDLDKAWIGRGARARCAAVLAQLISAAQRSPTPRVTNEVRFSGPELCMYLRPPKSVHRN
jgi:hypothetical protein